MPDRGGVPQRHQVVVELEAVLSFRAFIGILPVSCGVGYPTTYKNDIILISELSRHSRQGRTTRVSSFGKRGSCGLRARRVAGLRLPELWHVLH